MSLLSDAPPVNVSPRLRRVPTGVDTEGDLACDLAAAYGLRAFEWQRAALIDVMGVRPDGRWAASRAGASVARQNGKNGMLEILELYVTSQLGMRVLHSAHEVKTARKAFKRLLDFYDNPRLYPELRALVREVRRTNGQEAVELHNGGCVEFVARTKSSGRGYSADILALDEAQELTDDELEAMMPTISASSNPQIILTGTPPKPEKPATVWRRFRAAAVLGEDPRACWIEYSAAPDADLDERATWADGNPGAPESISWQTIADERAAMSDEGFAVERCGKWLERVQGAGILPDWMDLADPSVEQGSPLAYSLEVGLGRTSATIGCGWAKPNGQSHLTIAKHAPGTDWIVPTLTAAREARGSLNVTLDAGTEALSFREALEAARITVHVAKSSDRAVMCGQFHDAALQRTLTHDGQEIVTRAIAGATWREGLEGARSFARRGGADISPLYALVLAAHGLTAKKPAGSFRSF